MKSLFLFLAMFITTGIYAQTRIMYGLFKKSDNTKIKGTSKVKGYEDQIEIYNYTGGSDNSATIEIEVPMGSYVADFRNLMNTTIAANQPKPIATPAVATKPVATNSTVIKQNIGLKQSPNLTQAQVAAPTLARMEISVTQANPNNNYNTRIASKVIMEDIKVESCIDDAANGKSKIKLKSARIGWIYYSYDPLSGKQNGSTKSGWNTITGSAWNNF